jgi:ankyrin repeat protein
MPNLSRCTSDSDVISGTNFANVNPPELIVSIHTSNPSVDECYEFDSIYEALKGQLALRPAGAMEDTFFFRSPLSRTILTPEEVEHIYSIRDRYFPTYPDLRVSPSDNAVSLDDFLHAVDNYTSASNQSSKSQSLQRIQAILKRGIVTGSTAKGATKETMLHYAAADGALDIVKQLLAFPGTDLDATTVDEVTPLWYAVQKGELEVVKFLLEQGANPRVTSSNNGRNLLMAAMMAKGYKSEETILAIIRLLVKARVEINYESLDKTTPLMMASYMGFPTIVEYLLQRGANPNAVNQDGNTAMLETIWNKADNFEKVLALLVKAGAKNSRMKDGKSATDLLQEQIQQAQSELDTLSKKQYNSKNIMAKLKQHQNTSQKRRLEEFLKQSTAALAIVQKAGVSNLSLSVRAPKVNLNSVYKPTYLNPTAEVEKLVQEGIPRQDAMAYITKVVMMNRNYKQRLSNAINAGKNMSKVVRGIVPKRPSKFQSYSALPKKVATAAPVVPVRQASVSPVGVRGLLKTMRNRAPSPADPIAPSPIRPSSTTSEPRSVSNFTGLSNSNSVGTPGSSVSGPSFRAIRTLRNRSPVPVANSVRPTATIKKPAAVKAVKAAPSPEERYRSKLNALVKAYNTRHSNQKSVLNRSMAAEYKKLQAIAAEQVYGPRWANKVTLSGGTRKTNRRT